MANLEHAVLPHQTPGVAFPSTRRPLVHGDMMTSRWASLILAYPVEGVHVTSVRYLRPILTYICNDSQRTVRIHIEPAFS